MNRNFVDAITLIKAYVQTVATLTLAREGY